MRQGQLVNVDFHRLLRQGDLSQNVYLQTDDFVYVRPSISSDIYVMGAVARPNVFPYSRELSLVSAIARAEGTLPYATLSHVAIVRGALSRPTIAVVDYRDIVKGKAPNVRLAPGDIVYVPFTPFRKLEKFADEILNQFVRTLAINEGRNAVVRNAPPVGVSVPFGP
jgi:protein involved in polysaccharide export with SLBB domain